MLVRLVLLLGLIACPRFAGAVIILEKNASHPLRGYLVKADAERVVVDVLLPGGEIRQRVLPRSAIAEMIQAVSEERLKTLRSDQPQGYRDYAEELAGKINDPEAHRTALRLYLIAAHLAPRELGRSCLLGMVALARSPEEARKFRAMTYLLDVDHNRSVLVTPPSSTIPNTLSHSQRDQLKLLLRALREGRLSEARTLAKRSGVAEGLEKLADLLQPADFAEVKQGEPLPSPLLAQVLRAELYLAGFEEPADEGARPKTPWSKAIASPPVPPLSLETFTEFDPKDCHYRDGKWVP